MSGGRIKVDGNAGDYAGCEMHGGLIQIAGNAGHRIGAAYPGSKKGMTDGTILIGGDVGSEVGASMRRGTLVVGGSCGDGRRFQYDRRQHPRVWIVRQLGRVPACGGGRSGSSAAEPTKLLPTFRAAGRFRPAFSSTPLSRTGSTRVPGRPGAARNRAIALSRRSGRPRKGRGLDENELTPRTTDNGR